MQFVISTAKMNAILSRVSKGVGNSKVLPITEYLKLNLTAGVLTVVATNSVNFITYVDRGVIGQDGEVLVKADKLIKLVAKTTKPELKFELKDGHIEVKGNGTYKVEVNLEDTFPAYEFDELTPGVEVDIATFKKMFAVNGASIAKEMIMPCLTGFNIGDNCVTTDGVKMCLNATSILEDRALISQNLAELLNTLTGEKVKVQKEGAKLLFSTSNVVIFGPELDGIEEFPDISSVLDIPYEDHVVVKKQSVLDTIDRLSLFVNPIDNNGVKLTFTADGLRIEDLKNNSSEVIEYVEKVQATGEVSACVNIQYLNDLLDSLSLEGAKIFYGAGLPLRIEEGAVVQFLSTMGDEQAAATE